MKIWDTYSEAFNKLNSRQHQPSGALNSIYSFDESITTTQKSESSTPPSDEIYQIQRSIRPLFGKPGFREPAFGDHPDFQYLRGTTQQEYGSVTTMFMDIEGSTRLGVLYSPQEVFLIKNSLIRCAIETIQAFDGHVHRIMGDAVMAYFRDSERYSEDSAIDAINCATVLIGFVKESVLPQLKKNDINHDLGIRIGIDYGTETSVLWASYGYPGMEEVTATSFHVDAAAKLQQSASRNSIMLGAGLRDFLDLPNEIQQVKQVEKDGESIPRPYIRPNYTAPNGNPINYRQFELKQQSYLGLLPLRQQGASPTEMKLLATVHNNREEQGVPIFSCSRSIAKNKSIRFDISVPFAPQLPAKVYFRVINTGQDALTHAGEGRGNHQNSLDLKRRDDGTYGTTHWEDTLYRGLHFLYIEIRNATNHLISKNCFSVYIK